MIPINALTLLFLLPAHLPPPPPTFLPTWMAGSNTYSQIRALARLMCYYSRWSVGKAIVILSRHRRRHYCLEGPCGEDTAKTYPK